MIKYSIATTTTAATILLVFLIHLGTVSAILPLSIRIGELNLIRCFLKLYIA